MVYKQELLKRRAAMPKRRDSRGIALIEALVGILIFTTGILGVVGLQAAMTKAQGSAKSRADASMLSNELIGSMWSDYSNVITAKNFAQYNSTATVPCTVDPCKTWVAKVKSALPDGKAEVITANTGGDPITVSVVITINWTLPGEGDHKYVTSTTVQ